MLIEEEVISAVGLVVLSAVRWFIAIHGIRDRNVFGRRYMREREGGGVRGRGAKRDLRRQVGG